MLRRLVVTLFVVALASLSAAEAGAQAICKLNTTNQTVTICVPSNSTTVGTTFHVNAGTTDTSTIQYIQLYVAYKLYATQHTPYLDATVTVPAGNNQNLTVQAHDASGVTFKSTIHVNVTAAPPYSISPLNPTVQQGATQQFTGSVASTWTSSCGSIDSTGLFTAPFTQGSCTVTGTASDGSGSASTNVQITSPLTITPAAATTTAGMTQQFTASQPSAWSTTCGTIDTTGLFTAPSSAGSCTITATATGGAGYTATAVDTVVSATPTALNYTTYKNDNARDGLQSQETILTPSNVNSTSFGQVFASFVDGKVWTQPLYMSAVNVNGVNHNLVFVGTSMDTMYAFDGDTGTQVWKTSLLGTGETYAVGNTLHSTVLPYVGITGTPVIDPATNTLYVVAESVTSAGVYFHRLHALDVASGAEKFGGPVMIDTTDWNAQQHLQRPALLLANGNVYISFGSNGDYDPYHGWMFAYNAANLSQVAAWDVTPEADAGAIWMGGSGPAADANGNIFVVTANGDWDGSTQWGQSVVKLSPTLDVVDYFTPYAHNVQTADDKDLGSGGIILLPANSGPYPNLAMVCSKLNTIYSVNRDNLGQIGTSTDNVVQQVVGQLGGTSGNQVGDKCFSTAAYWNNNVYFMGNNDVLKQFSLNPSTSMMSSTPVYQDTTVFAFPGGQPVVSSNGNSNAIVWAMNFGTKSLYAFDATNVSNVLYTSPALTSAVKWSVPTVVNGHVYVGVNQKLVAFGLLTAPACAPPSAPGAVICTPVAGQSYNSPITVTAAGTPNAGATTTRMELWLDGKKVNNYPSNIINTTITATSGAHGLTAIEVDSTGATLKSTKVNFNVN